MDSLFAIKWLSLAQISPHLADIYGQPMQMATKISRAARTNDSEACSSWYQAGLVWAPEMSGVRRGCKTEIMIAAPHKN